MDETTQNLTETTNNTDIIPSNSGITPQELEAFTAWLKGDIVDVPQGVSKLVANIQQRLSVTQAFQVMSNLQRQLKLQKIINTLELDLFDPDQIENLDRADKVAMYDRAMTVLGHLNKQANSFMDTANKYNISTKGDLISQKIHSLTPEQLNRLGAFLENLDAEIDKAGE